MVCRNQPVHTGIILISHILLSAGFCDHIILYFSSSLSSETKVFCFRNTLDLLRLKNFLVFFIPFGKQHVIK